MVYKDIIQKGQFNINKRELFFKFAEDEEKLLTEDEELLLTRELTNFISWSSTHLDIINDLLIKENKTLYNDNKQVDIKILTEFWLNIVGKSKVIEEIIDNIGVTADIYKYMEVYYIQISSLMPQFDFRMVSKSIYRTEEQREKLLEILNKHDYKTLQLQAFFRNKQVDIDHIDKNNAQNLINRLS